MWQQVYVQASQRRAALRCAALSWSRSAMDGRAVAPSSGGSLPLYRLAAASSAAGPRREAHAETAEFAGLLADARLRQRGGGAWRAPSAAARRGRPRAALLVAALGASRLRRAGAKRA